MNDQAEQMEHQTVKQQLEVAIQALHVIAVLGESESTMSADIAMDALREMETFGMMYDLFDID